MKSRDNFTDMPCYERIPSNHLKRTPEHAGEELQKDSKELQNNSKEFDRS